MENQTRLYWNGTTGSTLYPILSCHAICTRILGSTSPYFRTCILCSTILSIQSHLGWSRKTFWSSTLENFQWYCTSRMVNWYPICYYAMGSVYAWKLSFFYNLNGFNAFTVHEFHELPEGFFRLPNNWFVITNKVF